MKLLKFSTLFIAIVSPLLLPLITWAGNGKPVRNLHTIYPILNRNYADTIPATKNTTDLNNNNQGDEVIKVVPKARRQAIPIPVGVQVKPIILIKPKIIKPIIKILH